MNNTLNKTLTEQTNWQLGDIARLKKPHACGSFDWRIDRVGMDMRLICTGCGRQVTLPRHQFNRRVKEKLPPR